MSPTTRPPTSTWSSGRATTTPASWSTGEFEIYVQRLDASGAEVGVNDRRVSDVGGIGDATRDANSPAVAHNAVDNQFLVVWEADEIDGESEVYGQRLGQGGGQLGTNDFRISDMGPDGNADLRRRIRRSPI